LFEAVSAVIAEAAKERPLLLVLEDLHWADKPTLLLLRHLVSAPEPARLLVLVTYRETELRWADPLAGALAEMRRERMGARLRLGGLDEQDVAALVTAWVGGRAPAELAEEVHHQTEGNPFFIEEVLSHLSESDAGLADVGVPEGVKDVVGRRLGRLGEETRRTLAAASVLGRRFDLHALDAVLEDLPVDRLENPAQGEGAHHAVHLQPIRGLQVGLVQRSELFAIASLILRHPNLPGTHPARRRLCGSHQAPASRRAGVSGHVRQTPAWDDGKIKSPLDSLVAPCESSGWAWVTTS